jgi:hypothetical protein
MHRGKIMASFYAALKAYLKSRPELSALTEVYADEAPENYVFPFLIVNELFESAQNNLTEAYYVALEVQFTVQAKDKAQSRSLALATRKAVSHSQMPLLVFDDGYEMQGRERGDFRHPRALPGRPEGDKVWQSSFDYSFLIGRSDV